MVSLLYNNVAVIGIIWIIAVTGILANSGVLIKVVNHSKKLSLISTDNSSQENRIRKKPSSKRKTFTILIVVLAVSDLIGSLYLLILALADIRYRFIDANATLVNNSYNSSVATSKIYAMWLKDPFCYIARFISVFSISLSTTITWLIAFDRFLNVFYPYSVYYSKHIIPISLSTLVISLLVGTVMSILASITVPYISLNKSYRYHNLCSVDNLEYLYVKLGLIILISIGTVNYTSILCMYCAILYKIRQNRVKNTTSSTINQTIERKILFTTAIICITNCLSWFPSITFSFITVLDYSSVDRDGFYQNIIVVLSIVNQVNCCVNPILLLLSTRNNIRLFHG